MPWENVAQFAGTFIIKYLAGFCLVSIIIWGMWKSFQSKRWQTDLRDACTFLVIIGLLMIFLGERTTKWGMQIGAPLVWFAFSMLLIFELLWISFLIDNACRYLRKTIEESLQRFVPQKAPPQHGTYHR